MIRKIYFKYLTAIVLLLSVLSTPAHAASFDTIGMMNTVHNHISAIREKNLEKAYHLYTSLNYKDSTSFEDFKKFVVALPPLIDNASVTLGTVSFEEMVGVYQGTLTTKKGEEAYAEYYLVREGRGWKIEVFKIVIYPK